MGEQYNRDLKLLLELMDDLKKEIRESQSMRLHVGLIEQDKRLIAETLRMYANKTDGMMTGHFPETHPTVLTE